MTTYLQAGDRISGDEIWYCFGVVPPPEQAGQRKVGVLKRHGTARVLRPLKRARFPAHRESDSVLCERASYECDRFQNKGKRTSGAHRGIYGYLFGEAWCEIVHPMENIPPHRQIPGD